MSKLFGALTGFIGYFQTRPKNEVKVDNSAFRLHYDFTCGLFFLATGLLGLNDMFGDAIQCRGSGGGGLKGAPNAVTQYCWVKGAYIVPEVLGGPSSTSQGGRLCKLYGYEGKLSGYELFEYSGNNEIRQVDGREELNRYLGDIEDQAEVDRYLAGISDCRYYQDYYQWVPYVFILQGLLFLLPHRLWLSLEEGKMKCLAEGARSGLDLEEKEQAKVMDRIAGYITKQGRGGGHRRYALSYLLCTGLNLVNVMASIFLLNKFIDNQFVNLGPDWLSDTSPHGKLSQIFPRMVMCQWQQFGSGGGWEIENFLCVLATNIITEKVFVLLWFWLVFLLLVSAASFLYLFLLLFSESSTVRNYFLTFAVKSKPGDFWGDQRMEDKEAKLRKFLRRLPRYNFLFLYMLSGNISHKVLLLVLENLRRKDEARPSPGARSRRATTNSVNFRYPVISDRMEATATWHGTSGNEHKPLKLAQVGRSMDSQLASGASGSPGQENRATHSKEEIQKEDETEMHRSTTVKSLLDTVDY